MDIVELRLATRDLAAQRAFYVAALGLAPLGETADTLTVGAGASRLVFEATAGGAAAQHVAFNIPENKLAEAKTWLAGRVTLLTREGEDEFTSGRWNSRQVYFADPAGNILEFIARHDLSNAAPGAFGPREVLGVSEVGLPVDDVPAAAALLAAELGIAPYQEQGATFAPLGDEHGLFIVVERGRPWFPTDTPAAVAPIAVALAGPRDRVYHLPRLPYRIAVVAR